MICQRQGSDLRQTKVSYVDKLSSLSHSVSDFVALDLQLQIQ